MFECPNCGGSIKFDIPSQKLACEHCDSQFDPYAFEEKTSDAEESTYFEATVFTCPQCGGELYSTDTSAAEFCPFCGASTIFYSRLSNEHRPVYIIPFFRTKEDCKKAYLKMVKKAIFAPKDLRDPKKIDSFRGIYMPYWIFRLTQQGPVSFHGEIKHRSGDYEITDNYLLQVTLDTNYKGLSYDASSTFADDISEAIAPYAIHNLKNFTPSFLSGFYADVPDVAPLTYQPLAEQFAAEQTSKKIEAIPSFKKFHVNSERSAADLHTKTEGADLAMFPVWFMSYRNGNRIAYATVNGQTGKVAADLPVDIKKFLLASFLLSIPISVLLNLFVTIVPSAFLVIASLFLTLSLVISSNAITKIYNSEESDRGKLAIHDPQKLATMNIQKKIKIADSSHNVLKSVLVIITILFTSFSLFPSLGDLFSSTELLISDVNSIMVILWFGVFSISLAYGTKALTKIAHVPERKGLSGIISAFIVLAINALIVFIHPVSDIFYYGAAILTLVSVFLCLKNIIEQYNILSTNALPQFNRKGGDDRA